MACAIGGCLDGRAAIRGAGFFLPFGIIVVNDHLLTTVSSATCYLPEQSSPFHVELHVFNWHLIREYILQASSFQIICCLPQAKNLGRQTYISETNGHRI